MPKTLDSYLADRALTRQLYLMRFSAGEQKKVLAILVDMRAELVAKLRSGDVTDFSHKRLNKLLDDCATIIDGKYELIKPIQVFRGGQDLLIENITDAGVSFSSSKQIAEDFAKQKGGKVMEYIINPRAKIIDYKDVPDVKFKNLNDYSPILDTGGKQIWRDLEIEYQKAINWAKKNGYDAVRLPLEGEIRIINIEKVKLSGIDLPGLAQAEAEYTAKSLVAVGLEASIPTVATMKAVVNGSLIEGAKSADWWAKQSNDLAFKFAAQVRQGIAQNETMTQIVRRIAGSEKLGIPGIFEGARQNAFALVHTSVMQVAADARLATYRANSDIVKGVRQLSVMDSRTSAVCVAYSGAEWDLDGNPINGTTLPFNGGPPRHWGCRSVLTSITKTFKELGIKGLPELPDTGERASDLGPIDRKTTMDQFLKMHDTDWQEKMLGKGKAALWRDGKITLSQLVDGTGRELTLEELKAL